MIETPQALLDYFAAGHPTVCELDAQPCLCEFWQPEELQQLNQEYGVPEMAPGFLGFATSGGGEMFAISPSGSIVCLPFIGMSPQVALPIAGTWAEFTQMLRSAV